MNNIDIEYNTEKPAINYPEYGRSIQEMLEFACTIPEPYKRQKTVESIIGMMQILNPAGPNRNMDDYREKLWNHAFAIVGYKLDVTPPPGVEIRREDDRPKLTAVEYPASAQRFRHYGNGIQALIAKAIEMPDGPKKEGFVEVIASYMKLAYKTWNKEHYVSDDIVKEDLELLSDGQLALHEGYESLDKLAAHAGKVDEKIRNTAGGGKVSRSKQQRQQRGNNNGPNRSKQQRGGNSGGNSGGGGGNYRKRKK